MSETKKQQGTGTPQICDGKPIHLAQLGNLNKIWKGQRQARRKARLAKASGERS